jgi:hypothetical protein
MVGAQTKGQFHLIYGAEGTPALFTGLATQIVYRGCDHDTADFYSKASGTTTADANPDPQKANFRQHPLLTVDEVVTSQIGNCTKRLIPKAYKHSLNNYATCVSNVVFSMINQALLVLLLYFCQLSVQPSPQFPRGVGGEGWKAMIH